MSDEIFRIVVAVGVALACIAFVAQAIIVFAMYRLVGKTHEKTSSFMGWAGPILSKVGPTIDKAGSILDTLEPAAGKVGAVIDRIGPVIQKVSLAVDRVPPAIERVQAIAEQTNVLVRRATELTASANQVVVTANQIMVDARPHVNEISTEAAAIVRTGREQVERVGELIHDAGEVARNRIQQIDHAVESTVEQVEHVGDSVKSAVMRPVREVNGLAAGISAAVATLVRGQHTRGVDAATQDEEMFI
jgi:methyl-accepting chemotaxis protein